MSNADNPPRKRRGPYAFSRSKGNLSGEEGRIMPKVTKWRLENSSLNMSTYDALGNMPGHAGPSCPSQSKLPDDGNYRNTNITDSDTDMTDAEDCVGGQVLPLPDMPDVGLRDDDYDEGLSLISEHMHDKEDVIDNTDFAESTMDPVPVEQQLHSQSTHDEETWYEAEEQVNHCEWYEAQEWLNDNDNLFEEGMAFPTTSDATQCRDDEPLYDGAPVTLAESMLLILTLCLRHSLTGSCLVDILTLVSLHCQQPNLCKTTLHLFRQYFSNLSIPLKFHKFCANCRFLLTNDTDECPSCKFSIASDLKSLCYFIEIPLLAQLQTMFKRQDFCEDIEHRLKRKKKVNANIEDIYDGNVYKRLSSPGGILNDKRNISFMWYTDGIPVFKSSKFSLWPLYFAINELPPKKRMRKENMLIAGIWYGEAKPCMETFLKPFHSALKTIYDGVNITNYLDEEVHIRGILLCGTCDMPAKCMVLNMTQFNGLYGCPRCTQPGEVISVGRGHARVFPVNVHNFDGPKRTHVENMQAAEEAFRTKQNVLGVKGPSWFSYHMPDIIHGTAVDWMHQVLLGIVRRLLFLWFDRSQSSEPYSISNLIDEVDSRLRNIKPPNFITRVPRSIKDHSKYWKASECRAWLLYYSLPVLSGLLADIYFQHYLLLVEAIYLLNGDSISLDCIDHCEKVLRHYCMMHASLYSQKQMTSNIHQLLHLCDVVRDLGPLWVYSCFTFESLNGELLSLFHGTQKVDLQIANNICILLKVPLLQLKLTLGTPISNFYLSMKNRVSQGRKGEQINDDTYTLGLLKKYCLNQEEKGACLSFFGYHIVGTIHNCVEFSRIMKKNIVICSKLFTLPVRRNSYTVSFLHDNSERYGQITKFVKILSDCTCVENCSCSIYLAFVEMFEISSYKISTDDITSASVQHIIPCKKNVKTIVAVPVEGILNVCVYMDFQDSDKVFVAKSPNTIEGD